MEADKRPGARDTIEDGRRFFFRFYKFPIRNKSTQEYENDSIWAVVSSFAKSYNLDPMYVLDNYSFANILMYGAVIPGYDDLKPEAKTDHKVINADDPANQIELEKLFR